MSIWPQKAFVDVRAEYFKHILCKIQEQFRQNVIDLYSCFNEMQGLYENFIKNSKTLEDHHYWIRVGRTGLEQVRG